MDARPDWQALRGVTEAFNRLAEEERRKRMSNMRPHDPRPHDPRCASTCDDADGICARHVDHDCTCDDLAALDADAAAEAWCDWWETRL